MAEEFLMFPNGIEPYAYHDMKKYDLNTALFQGTLFPLLDDHYRRQVRIQNELGDDNG